MKPILLNAVIAVIKYRKDSNNKEFLKEEEKSRKKLNDALNSLTDMIEEAQYRRFKFYKTLTYEDRIYRLVRAMDKEREICQILDMSLSGSISESTIYTRITSP
nr:SJCHGC02979 protein [Schistosoma japonicum]